MSACFTAVRPPVCHMQQLRWDSVNAHQPRRVGAPARRARSGVRLPPSTRRVATTASWKQYLDFAAIPAWIIKSLAMAAYPAKEAGCGDGKYEDPNAHACVYICKEGWEWDQEKRACVPVVCTVNYEWDDTAQACVPIQRSQFAKRVAEQVFDADHCPVGYYVDHNTRACTPVCREGYRFDSKLKKCVPDN
eukprot:CAMPEP_0114248960 /NCGR_PEP_ID=MMETSP0058-20121206/13863_1 /TAXON_ID=36894 /ORGANISM="Pyramimonas parkeae, CCMP726" /LENGTH=190 /DNA_ID=CAMNT_0001362425 /DNA_START=75 /DNA_END=647 /DNA_ORIENTATION=+